MATAKQPRTKELTTSKRLAPGHIGPIRDAYHPHAGHTHLSDGVPLHQYIAIASDLGRYGVDNMAALEEQAHTASFRWSATSRPALKTSSSARRLWMSSNTT